MSLGKQDKANIVLNIIALLWPIVGLILYAIFHEQSPVRAKAIGKYAIIGAGIHVLLFSILIFYNMLDPGYLTQ